MTRRAAPVHYPVALTIAGTDSGGAAGVQADLKTMETCGAYGTSVVTSVTAQNTRGVHGVHHLPPEDVTAQFDAVTDDYDVRAAKTGMLGTPDTLEAVVAAVADFDGPLVVDPVLVATAGDALADDSVAAAYDTLFAHATLLTPNASEAAALLDTAIETRSDAVAAAEALRAEGADAVLLTGGEPYADDAETAVDVLVTADGTRTFANERVATERTHGSGCTISSAITARLARGDDLATAVETGIDVVARAIRYPHAVGGATGSVHHLATLRNDAARAETAESVRDLDGIESAIAAAGATPHAESLRDIAVSGAEGCVHFGAESAPAELLLAARERDPALRYALTVHFDATTLNAPICAPDSSLSAVERVASAFEAADGDVPPILVDPVPDGADVATAFAADPDTLRSRLAASDDRPD
ncbi:bifunctional hydroxymethylpyrimidine kinase/phosphomethylpyrimidine kinase [Halarchaeum acidiphilum]|uniref:bifunctional hydroxymethylpyrimidine kinase/phosphomethylpyrimidine kinase n=1 Tax=Halarchaeum acidiphilum TaxID=489138 RepID=UPI0006779875|nr:bifunctional hydroxymethylpyrimidine kinase/phosphomethylpyrimidine kinase [Halarchaeum acidiphilum]